MLPTDLRNEKMGAGNVLVLESALTNGLELQNMWGKCQACWAILCALGRCPWASGSLKEDWSEIPGQTVERRKWEEGPEDK